MFYLLYQKKKWEKIKVSDSGINWCHTTNVLPNFKTGRKLEMYKPLLLLFLALGVGWLRECHLISDPLPTFILSTLDW